jgi:hypothetical protein
MKKLKKILIFQTGEPIHGEKSSAPMRLINLADVLEKHNYEVEILTSRFSHQEKKFRDDKILLENHEKKIKYHMVESPGYKNNISLKRLYDHMILGINVKKKLTEIKNIDYVFMGYPPIEACFFLARWCVNKKIPYILDYKDHWPDLFAYKKNFIIKIFIFVVIFFYKLIRNYVITNSSGISTISDKFLDNLNLDKVQQDKKITCYLTKKKSFLIDLKNVRKDIRSHFPSQKIKIVFIGNFMVDAFDFKVLKKIEEFIKKSPVIEFFFFGSGPSKNEIVNSLNFKNIYIKDRVNSFEFQYIMENAQAVFLPIKNRFDYLKSIPNKVVDAIQYKLPIFTSLKGETKFLIEKYNLGFFYENDIDLLNKLKLFSSGLNRNLFKKHFDNPQVEQMFDHDLNYKKILNKIKFDLI